MLKKIHVSASRAHHSCMLSKLLLLEELLDGRVLIALYLYVCKDSTIRFAQIFLKHLQVKDATDVQMGEIAPLQISVLALLDGQDMTAGPQYVKF